jgi:hypothetical protein
MVPDPEVDISERCYVFDFAAFLIALYSDVLEFTLEDF